MAGTEQGFAYRIIYIDPCLVQAALGARPLPFLPNPVIDLTDLQKRAIAMAWEMDTPIDDIGRTDITAAVSDMLLAASSDGQGPSSTLRLPGLLRVRSLIAERPAFRQSIADLELVADLDRWSLARQFRAAFDTAPLASALCDNWITCAGKPRWTQALLTKAICRASSSAPIASRPGIG
jgi:hypothetical protein